MAKLPVYNGISLVLFGKIVLGLSQKQVNGNTRTSLNHLVRTLTCGTSFSHQIIKALSCRLLAVWGFHEGFRMLNHNNTMGWDSVFNSIEPLLFSLAMLGVVAFFTLFERKGMAAIQLREGPNTAGPFGLLQPIADGLKLLLKDDRPAEEIGMEPFYLAPIISFVISFAVWAFVPTSSSTGAYIEHDLSLILLIMVLSFGIYGIILTGVVSKSKYALLGSLRAIAQCISYEIYLTLALLPLFITTGSLDLAHISERQTSTWFCLPFLPLMIAFVITMLIETNRAPFDLPEAEAELVAGFNVEYGGSVFALFFLAEYNSMLVSSALLTLLFFGGDVWPFFAYAPVSHSAVFIAKFLGAAYIYVFVRANFPRVRFDQMLMLGWKVLLPIMLAFVFMYGSLFVCFG